jgi:hypothetical protein
MVGKAGRGQTDAQNCWNLLVGLGVVVVVGEGVVVVGDGVVVVDRVLDEVVVVSELVVVLEEGVVVREEDEVESEVELVVEERLLVLSLVVDVVLEVSAMTILAGAFAGRSGSRRLGYCDQYLVRSSLTAVRLRKGREIKAVSVGAGQRDLEPA